MLRAAYLLSLWLGAVILVPSGAHVLEMPGKLAMGRETYFATQQIYLGWALFGAPIVLKVVLDAALGAALWRRDRIAAVGALSSSALIACGLIVFFGWVQRANLATANWANQPDNWLSLRGMWEYGHAVVALLTLLAFGAISYGACQALKRGGWGP